MWRLTDMEKHSRLILQFHITGRCNLQCKHCYRTDGNVEPLTYEDVIAVIEQFKDLRTEYNRRHRIQAKGHINLTGGEPFFRTDIHRILAYLGENQDCLTYGILSNGSFLDDRMIAILKETHVSFVQLSIDGDRAMHDSLRTAGDYDRVLHTAEVLEKKGIRTYISFTANQDNYRFLPAVARACRRRRITKLWSDRLVPIGNGEALETLAISSDILPDYLKTMKRAGGSLWTRTLHPHTQVTANRALQFLGTNGLVYTCSAGDRLITVDEFGNIMPCRRMPILCGSIFKTTLKEVYYHHDTFRQLRLPAIPKECRQCKYSYDCRGGARCQSYARYGSFFRADPACPLKCTPSADAESLP
ncbi:MAG: radical SAM protein [Clostridia bacterium]|nr:radical SAM protein [Clostridia bacterium]